MKNKLTFVFLIPLLVSGISLQAQRYIEQRINSDDGRSHLLSLMPG